MGIHLILFNSHPLAAGEGYYEKAVLAAGRRCGFAFATSKAGGIRVEFFEAQGAETFETLAGGPLDYEKQARLIEDTLSHIFQFYE